MPLLRIDRVIEDEVEFLAPLPEPETTAPALALSFTEGAPVPDGAYGGLAWWAAKKHAVNPRLVAAVARAESNWNPRARSRKGACGLMQIMPATGRRFGLSRSELYDAKKNLEAGSRYLAWLVDRFDGDLELVLAAYNAGEGAVDRYRGVPPYRETREYIRRIYGYLGIDTAPQPVLAAAVETAAVLIP
jgi:soluble lytic murein transglycosylase-like protein